MKFKEETLFENGHLSDESLARYANTLTGEESSPMTEEVLTHVEACSECKDKILELTMFLRNPDKSVAQPAIPQFLVVPEKPRRRWNTLSMRLAATFFVTALLLGTYFFVYKDGSALREILFPSSTTEHVKTVEPGHMVQPDNNTTPENNGGTTSNGNGGVKTTNRLRPPNFRVNPNLENMIGTQYRSVAVQIVSPLNNSTLHGDIVFAWKKNLHSPLTLKIINNKNEVAYNYAVEGNHFVFKQKLVPGLYYWKLENRQDLLHIGKFFIKNN